MKNGELSDMFLTRYFAYEAVFAEIVADKRQIFDTLASVYCIGVDDKESLYALTRCEDIVEVDTKGEYERTMRVIDYLERTNKPVNVSTDILFALSCKGAALAQVEELQELLGAKPGREHVIYVLNRLTASQNVFDMSAAAFILLEGLTGVRDYEKGIRLAKKSADWNCVDSILMLLHYDTDNKEKYLTTLKAVLKRGDVRQYVK